MKDKLIEEAQSRLQNMDGGSIEQMGQNIDAMENGQRYGYDDQGGNAGGCQGYREPYMMARGGD